MLRQTVDKEFTTASMIAEGSISVAAIALIGERGVDGATTAQIAKRVGVSEKTLALIGMAIRNLRDFAGPNRGADRRRRVALGGAVIAATERRLRPSR